MSFWTGVLLGFIAGWVAEWIIDWNYWRRRTRVIHDAAGESATLRSDLDRCRTETACLQNDLTATANLAQQRASEIAVLQAALDNARAELAQVRQQLNEREERIAGLETARQSDRAEIERLKSAVQRTEQEPASMHVAPETTLLQGVSAPSAATYATARLAEDDVAAELARLRAELEEERRTHLLLRGSRRDPLIDINGIGPVYEKRLNAAGIQTFAELAALTPERIRAIIKPENWQLIEPDKWIEEARLRLRRANPDPLIDINGIGPVYQQKLFDADIYTFEQLAGMTPEQIAAIIQPEEWQNVDFNRWIAEAAQFASRQQMKEVGDGNA
jgi:predicted flap endonuclease-1-like 5' DNA nuclease